MGNYKSETTFKCNNSCIIHIITRRCILNNRQNNNWQFMQHDTRFSNINMVHYHYNMAIIIKF